MIPPDSWRWELVVSSFAVYIGSGRDGSFRWPLQRLLQLDVEVYRGFKSWGGWAKFMRPAINLDHTKNQDYLLNLWSRPSENKIYDSPIGFLCWRLCKNSLVFFVLFLFGRFFVSGSMWLKYKPSKGSAFGTPRAFPTMDGWRLPNDGHFLCSQPGSCFIFDCPRTTKSFEGRYEVSNMSIKIGA